MSRVLVDFNPSLASKGCGFNRKPWQVDPEKTCIGENCQVYPWCNIREKKTPWREPLSITEIKRIAC